MKIRQSERITGYEVRRVQDKPFTVAAFDGEREVMRGEGKTEKDACQQLVGRVYRLHCRIVDEQQGYRCARCGSLGSLQHDHKVLRGMGAAKRDDRVANLQSLCPSCHEKKHKSCARLGIKGEVENAHTAH